MVDAWLSLLGVPAAWAGRTEFTLLDTDFGQGFRFFQVWEAWRQDPNRSARLHVVGFLDHLPVRPGEISQRCVSQLKSKVDALAAQWPLNLPGLHRLEFEAGAVTLTLGVGPVPVLLKRLRARVDAFYLCDPGADALQVALSENFMPELARTVCALARPQARLFMPGTPSRWLGPLASLGVLSQLEQRPGLDLTNPGDACATFSDKPCSSDARDTVFGHADPWQQSSPSPHSRHVLVVGAGFAGMGVAQSFALRGWRVSVLDGQWGHSDSPHQQHAGAALTPMLARDDNIRARLSRAGSLRAQARWGALPEAVLSRCGAIQLQRNQGRIVELAEVVDALRFPDKWARFVSREQASEIAGLKLDRGGIYFPTAARIDPQALLGALASNPGIEVQRAEVLTIRKQGASWQACDSDDKVVAQAPYVVLAGGFSTRGLLERSGLLATDSRLAAMHALGGEITFVPEALLAGGPRCIVGGDGYVLPSRHGVCVAGSSYLHGAKDIAVTPVGVQGNLKRASGLLNLPGLPEKVVSRTFQGWAGWRAVLPGRLPAIGPVAQAEGLWVATGFASRGLTWATLAGDLIAGALNGEPITLENDIIEVVSEI